MNRDEAKRWQFIVNRDMQLATYSLAMGYGAKEYLRARIVENEAILYALASFENAGAPRRAWIAPHVV